MRKLILILFLFCHAVFASPQDDVLKWYRQYAAEWLTGPKVNLDKVLTYYNLNYVWVDATGVYFLNESNRRTAFVNFVNALAEKGWISSEPAKIDIQFLNPATALLTVVWLNYRDDGGYVDDCKIQPYTYTVSRTDQGWHFVSVIEHACNVSMNPATYQIKDTSKK